MRLKWRKSTDCQNSAELMPSSAELLVSRQAATRHLHKCPSTTTTRSNPWPESIRARESETFWGTNDSAELSLNLAESCARNSKFKWQLLEEAPIDWAGSAKAVVVRPNLSRIRPNYCYSAQACADPAIKGTPWQLPKESNFGSTFLRIKRRSRAKLWSTEERKSLRFDLHAVEKEKANG